MENLVDRRLRDAFLFLYGMYDNDGPDAYTYIHFDPSGGSIENQTVFYPVGAAYGQLPVPTLRGRSFLGWHTTGGGAPLTGDELALSPLHVTAQWDAEAPSQPEVDLSAWVNPYSDVKDNDWFFSYVRELSAKGIVGGAQADPGSRRVPGPRQHPQRPLGGQLSRPGGEPGVCLPR